MINPKPNEKNATIRITLSSGDLSNPLPDLTTAASVDFYIRPANTKIAQTHVTGSAYNSTTVQFNTGSSSPFTQPVEYEVECVVTWPDGGTNDSLVYVTVEYGGPV